MKKKRNILFSHSKLVESGTKSTSPRTISGHEIMPQDEISLEKTIVPTLSPAVEKTVVMARLCKHNLGLFFWPLLFLIYLSKDCTISDKPTFEEMRAKITSTPNEEPRLCITIYPNSIHKDFSERDVGETLYLTGYCPIRRATKP